MCVAVGWCNLSSKLSTDHWLLTVSLGVTGTATRSDKLSALKRWYTVRCGLRGENHRKPLVSFTTVPSNVLGGSGIESHLDRLLAQLIHAHAASSRSVATSLALY